MILAERPPITASIPKPENLEDQFKHFGEAMNDGRLTEQSNSIKFRLRDAIILSCQLGRPLTEEEMKKFEIH